MKVLHVLESSLPKIAGYTIRSKYIVENQRNAGIETVVITSPLHGKTDRALEDYEVFDGIRYYRTGIYNDIDLNLPLPLRLLKRFDYAKKYKEAIQTVSLKEKPDIIHAHSSYLNGNRANLVGKHLRIPTIFEVRGLWGDTAVANENITATSWKYRFINHMENKAISEATKVVIISKTLKDELIERGIKSDKIHIVPNGIDTDHFVKQAKDSALVDKYELKDNIVLGFIGSVRKIEGLDLLIKVLPILRKSNQNIKIMIVGGGSEIEHLKKLSSDLGVTDNVIFCGQVSHEVIMQYYSLIDVFVYPRINARVNQKVTPLKPLEAMAMEKPVIASNVNGLAELVKDNEIGRASCRERV